MFNACTTIHAGFGDAQEVGVVGTFPADFQDGGRAQVLLAGRMGRIRRRHWCFHLTKNINIK
ncbi:MAG: hypothetical protein ACTSSI_06920 [Candidatus Helarchaeota archaeon]